MADEPNDSASDQATLAVPGVLYVSPTPSGQKVIHLGPAAGWMAPSGIVHWEKELSFVARADLTAALARALHATRPDEQIAEKRFAMTKRAVEASPLLALSSNLVEGVNKEGVRVHTVGVDRVSADFYYFAEGGPREPLRVQGNLVEMLAPVVDASTPNEAINALLASLIDRLLSALSGGVVSELDVELADALPRLSRDGTGLVGTDLTAFEARAHALADRSERFGAAARELVEALATATREGRSLASVPLYGEARKTNPAPLEVRVMGELLQLPARSLWTVTGNPREPRVGAPVERSPRAAAKAARADGGGATRGGTPVESTVPPAAAAPSSPPPASPLEATAGTATASDAVALGPEAARAPSTRFRRSSSVKSPVVPIFLLLAFAASLYFLWHAVG